MKTWRPIPQTINGKLALLVGTHEHLDHLSGFNSQRKSLIPWSWTIPGLRGRKTRATN
jgi:phosphoribosyl 1,2-cyclic phosphodiesterase